VSFFGFSFPVLIPSMSKDVLHRGATTYAIILSLIGLGAAVGAPLVTYLGRRYKEREIIKICMLAFGLLLVAFGLVKVLWISCVLSIGLGLAFLMVGTTSNSVLQGCSDRAMRGRVVSFYIVTFIGFSALGGQFMGYLADARSTQFALTAGGIACTLPAVVLILFPGLIRLAVTPKEPRELEPDVRPTDEPDQDFCEF